MHRLRTEHFEVEFDRIGNLIGLRCSKTGREFASGRLKSPIVRVRTNGATEAPSGFRRTGAGMIALEFKESGLQIEVSVEEHPLYLTFEVKRITGPAPSVLLWGPYATTLSASIGESVGIVHDGEYAIGIQTLNEKTIGGHPVDVPAGPVAAYADAKMDYSVSAAWPTAEGGSLLQAYVRNRTRAERRAVWGQSDIFVAPLSGFDAELEGSRIALFGCPVDRVLDTLETIELGEGLPHPTIDGAWAKTSPAANQSYLISDFSESTIGEAVGYAKQAGLRYVYHPEPFNNWGHFELNPSSFPNGDQGMRSCVELAEREGVYLGVHTLTNFTSLNDPFVTPVPDPRLQRAGSARLTAPVGAEDAEITVDDPVPFRLSLYRRTVVVGGELIEYEAVSDSPPWTLLGCKRGANGTTAAAHAAGMDVGRLWDHPYDVFFPDLALQDEYGDRLAELFRNTGLRQISFDGLEGVYATGHEDYAASRFVKRCFDGWDREVINDASIVVPNFLWHVHTRFNWGEPWGAATREGQLQWRLHNQRYFARNFIPRMLGWFLVRSASNAFEATTMDEIEWVLSKAAGFDAGFALVADLAVLRRNGNVEALLSAVREWERARRMKAFTTEQQARMQDPKSDWHLEPIDPNRWSLYEVDVAGGFVCSPEELQPGQPGGADWAFYNRFGAQALRFSLKVSSASGAADACIRRPSFQLHGQYLAFETEIAVGEYLVCDGDGIGKVYDRNWNLLRSVAAATEPPTWRSGGQTISFSCRFSGEPKPTVEVTFFTRGEPDIVRAAE
ncbi:hypothetical protein [Paenibacillus sp.]|uniref:hypothetical protein n=1 Tax=Paenibacillus sp. TaxID=58172 RepID=UPI002810AD98|nr:hypothetical protein [Paenibacillus sp.]